MFKVIIEKTYLYTQNREVNLVQVRITCLKKKRENNLLSTR